MVGSQASRRELLQSTTRRRWRRSQQPEQRVGLHRPQHVALHHQPTRHERVLRAELARANQGKTVIRHLQRCIHLVIARAEGMPGF